MVFENPSKFEKIEIVEKREMNYEYAVKNTNKSFEVYYAIRPLYKLLKKYTYKENNMKKGDINVNRNKFFNSLFQTTLLNISGGQLPELNELGKQAIKHKFNADWGPQHL